MTLQTIIKDLLRLKESGRWRDLAAISNVDYGTIGRIAREEIKSPGILICERLSKGIKQIDRFQRSMTQQQG